MIYEPAEDSFLLQKHIKKYSKNKKILDMGTGSGIQALEAKKNASKVLACDINKGCVNYVKKLGIKTIKSDLFSNIKEKFDLIIFNPPYLPEEPLEPLDSKISTTGGKKGNEILKKFLSKAKNYLNPKGKILILFSSLTPDVINIFKKYDYKYKKLDSSKISFETLYVYLIE